ncbi:hypothetical protein [Burkholderia pseudomallei]|uniref:hypothetical protein n=1 Tax=Burkholderia pseudomallei TaxID=28450 RepID=UPI0005311A2E|nr:hypothetical protein [Burkholderia pseudomallei]KGX76404.1 hypothetical protein Y033_2089 [Burkholderia pseudomallei MSHR435]AJX21887.1 hypothetical protein BG17_691 [Burkholderia pseudomallei MSHR491]AJX76455.1 hypothetical protein BG16_2020 [Burkholderia pseudomallei MSHR2543]KGS74445.1 hypothetical protein X942_5455 [Burkholderia pseudomallei MSHR5596]KGW90467.1 hypothetical protein Y034_1595 [Burkholderia pseudomallei MSHR449]
MKLHVFTCSDEGRRARRIAVDGDRIDFPEYPTELFAAHANPVATTAGEPAFVVTHVGTGFRIAGGKTQAAAISMAKRLIKEKSTEEFWQGVFAARKLIKAYQTLS